MACTNIFCPFYLGLFFGVYSRLSLCALYLHNFLALNMANVIISSAFLFFVALAVHGLWTRFCRGAGEIKTVSIIYLITSSLFLLVSLQQIGSKTQIIDYGSMLHIWVLFTLLYLAFMMTLPALMIEIPTFKIIRLIDEQPGVSEQQLSAKFNLEEMNYGRINNLAKDNLIQNINGELRLTTIGKVIAKLFYGYRSILGLGIGGG